MDKARSKRLQLNTASRLVISEIEHDLNLEVIGITRVTKIYGSNANSYLIKAIDKDGIEYDFFLKFIFDNDISREVLGTGILSKYLKVPRILDYRDAPGMKKWVLYEKINGKLLSELYLHNNTFNTDKLTDMERIKEESLVELYTQSNSKLIDYDTYKHLHANNLFQKRLFGDRYKDFYHQNGISKHLDSNIIVNGKKLPKTINQVFQSIKQTHKKQAKIKDKSVQAYLSHGDAHHGNIILTDNNEYYFIDNEYWGYLPVSMELAKPYYNDFLGDLFFHQHDLLTSIFKIKNVILGNDINVDIDINKDILSPRLAITNEKIKIRKKLIDSNTDFLSLNDYLFMCHTLNKNPNLYPEDVKILFLIFSIIIFDFDPQRPESIFDYF